MKKNSSIKAQKPKSRYSKIDTNEIKSPIGSNEGLDIEQDKKISHTLEERTKILKQMKNKRQMIENKLSILKQKQEVWNEWIWEFNEQ